MKTTALLLTFCLFCACSAPPPDIPPRYAVQDSLLNHYESVARLPYRQVVMDRATRMVVRNNIGFIYFCTLDSLVDTVLVEIHP